MKFTRNYTIIRNVTLFCGICYLFSQVISLFLEKLPQSPLVQLLGNELINLPQRQSPQLFVLLLCCFRFLFSAGFTLYITKEEHLLKEAAILYTIRNFLLLVNLFFPYFSESFTFYLLLLGMINILTFADVLFFFLAFRQLNINSWYPRTVLLCLGVLAAEIPFLLLNHSEHALYGDIIASLASLVFGFLLLFYTFHHFPVRSEVQ